MFNKKTFNNQRYSVHHLGMPDEKRVSLILELAGSNKKILDVGCCDGYIGSLLMKQNNIVYGTDISTVCVKNSIKNGIKAKVLDIEKDKIPFETKFDVITAGEIIEHVVDTDGFLTKMSNALKIGGTLIITTPNLAALGRRLLLLAGKNPHMEVSYENYSAGHVRYFIKDTLKWLLEKNGFKVETILSDTVNFNASGSLNSKTLAYLFPTLGKTLIAKCTKL